MLEMNNQREAKKNLTVKHKKQLPPTKMTTKTLYKRSRINVKVKEKKKK